MTTTITKKLLASIIILMALAFASALPAFAHNGVDHSADAAESAHDTDRVATMKALVAILQQLVELLAKQAAASGHTVVAPAAASDAHDEHAHEAAATDPEDILKLWIEVHEGTTHVHLDEPGKDFSTFFLDDVSYTDEAGVIAAIAARTGLSVETITEVIVFPHDTSDGNLTDTDEYTGVHIMADGTIMLGNGTPLADATITADGMIELSDGTLLEPAFDLR